MVSIVAMLVGMAVFSILNRPVLTRFGNGYGRNAMIIGWRFRKWNDRPLSAKVPDARMYCLIKECSRARSDCLASILR
jgi:hypothetical protein